MNPTIEVRNIWIEDLFEWFYNHVAASGGDGCGIIVCQNYKEAANYFIKWWEDKYSRSFIHPLDEYENIINFHDGNENFIFTNDDNAINWSHEYVFIVREDCEWGWTSQLNLGKLIGIPK